MDASPLTFLDTMTTTSRSERATPTTSVLVSVDLDGTIMRMSPSVETLLGVRAESLTGTSLGELCTDGVGVALLQGIARAAEESWTGAIGRYWLRSAGRPDVLADVFLDSSTADAGTLHLALADVTGAYVEEQKARSLGHDGHEVLDDVAMAVTRWSPSLRLEYHSDEFAPLVMADTDILVEAPAIEDVGLTPAASRRWRDALAGVLDSGEPTEFEWETDDGRHIHSRALAEQAGDGCVASLLVVSHDVTEERSRYEELTRRALYDPLTGLANRATTHAYIERALSRRDRTGTSEALIFVDLDHFKSMNDSLGHAAGDEILVAVARRLSSNVRPNDVVGRLGGDEFVIYLEQMDGIDAVLAVVDRLRDAIAADLSVGGHELRLRASIGVAFASESEETPDSLVAKADAAMYKAKASGRDCVELYDDELRQRAEQRTRNERALRRAMRNGEMEVHFLPEFDLGTQTVVGAEALLRWQHPRRGLIPAAHFIALAEETGLLIRLGNEVLRRSCELVAGWLRNRTLGDFTLRVNISPKQLAQPTLAPFVEEVLQNAKLDPEVLCLELAEATLTSRGSDSARQLGRLRDLGVKVSVDDFGTAASSLVLLKQWPIDMLKIDMSFVQGLGIDSRDDAIVEAIINLGAALGIDVVAEGIDTPDQLRRLIELDCRLGQGFGLCHVLTPNEFIRRWL